MQFILESANEKIAITENIFIVGRALTHNLVIKHPSISKDHAMIEIRQHRIFLKDLEALNGTKVNGVRLEKNQEIELANNDEIEFGKTNVLHVVRMNKNQQKAATKQTDKKINLKDYFEPVPEGKVATAVEKKINVNNINLPSATDFHQELEIQSEMGGIRSGVAKERPKSTKKIMDAKIKFNSLEDFLKDEEIQEPERPNKIVQPPKNALRTFLPQPSVTPPAAPAKQPKVESPVRPPPNLSQLEYLRHQKAEELQAIASEYEAMYRQKLLKTKANLKSLEKQQVEVIASIEAMSVEKQQIQQKLKVEQEKWYEAQQNLLSISTKNQIMILYAQHLQNKQVAAPTNIAPNNTFKEISDVRKLLKIKCKEIKKTQEENDKFLDKYVQQHGQQSHLVRQLKQNIQQIISIKSQLYEFIQREKEVEAQWENELKRNNDATQSIKSLLIEIRRNSDNMKHTQNENARKLCDYHIQFTKLMKSSKIEKRKASEYLVEKMQEIQKQKIEILEDCQNVHLRIEQTLHEIENIQRQLKALTELVYSRFEADKDTLPQHELMYSKIEYLTKEAQRYDLIGNIQGITRMRADLERYELKIEQELALHESLVKNIGRRSDVSSSLQPVWQYFSKRFLQKDMKILELKKEQDRLTDLVNEEKSQIRELEARHDKAKRKFENFKEGKIKEAMDAIREGKRCL